MSKPQRETLTARVSVSLIERIDRLAERTERSRSEMTERVLLMGIDDAERIVKSQEHPVGGRVWDLMANPKVVAFLETITGTETDPEEIEKVKRHVRRSRGSRESGVIREAKGG